VAALASVTVEKVAIARPFPIIAAQWEADMTVRITIKFEDEGEDREYQADLLAVPRVGEHVSIGSLNGDKLQRFTVQRVVHFQLDDKSGVELYCRKLSGLEPSIG